MPHNPYQEYQPEKKQFNSAQKSLMHALHAALMTGVDFQTLNVSDLCRFASMSRTTFYVNYSHLREVLDDLEERMLYEFYEASTEMLKIAISPDAMKEDLRKYISYLLQHRAEYEPILIKHPDPVFIQKWKGAIKCRFYDFYRKRKDYDFVLEVLSDAMFGGILYFLQNITENDFDSYVDSVFQLYILFLTKL